MAALRTLLSLLVLASGAAVANAVQTGETVPLFAGNEVLDVTIRAPLTTIMRRRAGDEDRPATLTYIDTDGTELTLELGIRARGNFRRRPRTCEFAPLRLNFRKSALEGTLFAGSDKMKLVTHCQKRSAVYSRALLSEYLAYRIFNLLTEASFRVRLMRVTYVDIDRNDRERTEFAFAIEHKEQLAKRIGLPVNEMPRAEIGLLDARQLNLSSLFQFLIGNTDFSPRRASPGEPCCHNYVLFGSEPENIVPVPYDFDMSGIVDAPHAVPSANFDIRNVRQRLYRGRCVNNEHIAASIKLFVDRREEIFELVNSNDYYDRRGRNATTRYLDDFYRIVEDPERVRSVLTDRCIGPSKPASRRES